MASEVFTLKISVCKARGMVLKLSKCPVDLSDGLTTRHKCNKNSLLKMKNFRARIRDNSRGTIRQMM